MTRSVSQSLTRAFARKALVSAIATASIGGAIAPQLAVAQQQTAAVTGRVYDAQGNPAANAEITIVDTRSGTRRTTRSGDSGTYAFRNLAAGGPYAISVNGARQTTIESLALGDSYQLSVEAANAVWDGPENLPSDAELDDADAWLRRVDP